MTKPIPLKPIPFKPCPFCGSKNLSAHTEYGRNYICIIECNQCGALSPVTQLNDDGSIKVNSVDLWNDRHHERELREQMREFHEGFNYRKCKAALHEEKKE